MKKLLSFFLAAVMALCALSIPALPANAAAPEYLPTPPPENLAWDGAVATWTAPSAIADVPGIENSIVYYFTLYKLGEDDAPVQIYSTSLYFRSKFDASMQIVKNGPGKYYFTLAAWVIGPSAHEDPVASPTAEFTAETLGKAPLPAPSVSSGWSLTSQGSEPLYWTLKWTYSQSTQLAADAKYHFHVTLYKNDEMVTETDVDSDKLECDFDADDELPYDSDDEFYIRVKAVPDEDETRYAESPENSGKGYASIIPSASLTRKLVDPEMELVRAGDTAMYFRTGWTGCYGGVNYMYIRLKITSADEAHTVTERSTSYWTLNYITGSRTRFEYSKYLNYTFKAGDYVEWEIYLTDTASSYYVGEEYANVSGSFTVEESTDHTVTLDACGKGENTTVTVPDRKYLSDVENVEDLYPVTEGYMILGWSKVQKPIGEYVYGDTFSGAITEDMTLYAVMKPVMDTAELHVSDLKCGDEITLDRNPYVYWYYKQSPVPTVTMPEGAPYRLESTSLTWMVYTTPEPDPEADPEDDPPAPYLTPFGGKVKGGESYYVQFYIEMIENENNGCDNVFAEGENMKLTGNFTSGEVTDSYSWLNYSEIGCRLRVVPEHVWSDWEMTTAPTAAQKGEATRVCSGCGETETKELPATEHKLTLVPAEAPTCTEPGHIAYYTCSHCDKLFADIDAVTETAPADTVVPATGHAWGAWTKLDDAQHQRVCANDPTHVETEAHDWKETAADAGTCIVKSTKDYECAVCKAVKTETGDFGEHAWGEWTKLDEAKHQRVCANDPAHTETKDHTWDKGKVTTPATETAEGVKTFTCTVCGATKAEPIPKTEPDFVLGDVDGNGKVETKDARLALRCSIGLENYAEGSREFKAADVNKNNKVGTDDARFILRKSVGLKDPEIKWN